MDLIWYSITPDMSMNLSAMCQTDCQKSCKGAGRHHIQQVWHFMHEVSKRHASMFSTASGLQVSWLQVSWPGCW